MTSAKLLSTSQPSKSPTNSGNSDSGPRSSSSVYASASIRSSSTSGAHQRGSGGRGVKDKVRDDEEGAKRHKELPASANFQQHHHHSHHAPQRQSPPRQASAHPSPAAATLTSSGVLFEFPLVDEALSSPVNPESYQPEDPIDKLPEKHLPDSQPKHLKTEPPTEAVEIEQSKRCILEGSGVKVQEIVEEDSGLEMEMEMEMD
eukprot:CAMPEP_0196597840 /NCGR_PEP_ID=MMETSP1081-20130531/93236_1 /TAXON_ID=36882 /ORGANISM="Pyramimonas amylifera, Strain CCMP720" /LENGTH=202 /DNA_ID=CAMNT_0041923377 /DNA_START=51 /DNA_END=656 /DNA_ORIENTATION=+